MDSCCFCKECTGTRETCQEPQMARPSPEGMCMDVYSTVRQFGYSINVCTDYDQQMDRYAFLMIR
jgi:predicted metal-binding protein